MSSDALRLKAPTRPNVYEYDPSRGRLRSTDQIKLADINIKHPNCHTAHVALTV